MSNENPNTTEPTPTPDAPGAPVPKPAADIGAQWSTADALPDYYYDDGRDKYWLRNAAGDWVLLSETQLRRELRHMGMRDKADPKNGEKLSPIDALLRRVEQDHRVAYGGELAGWPAGLHRVAGNRVLVCRGPQLIEPRKIEWPTLRSWFDGMWLGKESAGEGQPDVVVDQRDRFYAYLQHTVQCLYAGVISSGLALCIAGEPDCGKTRLAADVLRRIFGGKTAKPYAWMIGEEGFNGDMLSATLLLVDDESADTRFTARQHLGAQIKKITANAEYRLRAMHRDGMTLELLWRLVILTNIEAHRLLVLPPIDGDIRDKVLMLKAYRRPKPPEEASEAERAAWPLPLPTRTIEERQEWAAMIDRELPGFVWWLLNEYVPPADVVGGRFVVRHWAHPQILSRLQKFSPVVRLMELFERSGVIWRRLVKDAVDEFGAPAEYEPSNVWEGTASELEQLLKSEASKLSREERGEVPVAAWLGQRLEEARDHFGSGVVEQRRTGTKRLWKIHRTEFREE